MTAQWHEDQGAAARAAARYGGEPAWTRGMQLAVAGVVAAGIAAAVAIGRRRLGRRRP